jgi:peptidoglycan/LPS O-acetylase OafA/YrhL
VPEIEAARGIALGILLRGTTLLVPSVAALSALLEWMATPDQVEILRAGLTNYLLVLLPFDQPGVIGPTWSLSIEIAFYASLPLLAVGIDRLARRGDSLRSRTWSALTLAALMIPAGIAYFSFAGRGRLLPDWLPAHINLFAVGMLFAIAAERWP